MSIFDDVTPEEEEDVLKTAYKTIREKQVWTAALLILRSFSPFSLTGGALARFFLGPLTPFMGHREEKWIWTLEKPENLNKLIAMLEADEEKREESRLESISPAS